jgi:hypothetical protein
LEVVGEERRHLGTTWVFELKARASDVKKVVEEGKGKAEEVVRNGEAKAGWRGWLGLK